MLQKRQPIVVSHPPYYCNAGHHPQDILLYMHAWSKKQSCTPPVPFLEKLINPKDTMQGESCHTVHSCEACMQTI